LARACFFITSKVWNDAQTKGRQAVRKSVEQSLKALDFGGYFDLFLIHWPVPGCFVETYKELEMLHDGGKIHNLGLSNFSPQEYEELIKNGINVQPVVNQLEVSPILYQRSVIDYFKSQKVLISAYKPLNRGANFGSEPLPELAAKYSKTEAQVMLRWGLQRGLIVVAKTATASRMNENRDVLNFSLTDDEMMQLDTLTTSEYVHERERNKFTFMQKTSK
jgi:diketogulonate reductase-like aldo/keto reductase